MRNSFISLLILFGLVMPIQDLSAKRQPAGMLIKVKSNTARKARNGERSEEINLSMINILFGSEMVDR